MRGGDGQTGELFSYVDLAARSSVADDSGGCERGAFGTGAGVRGAVLADRAAVDPTEKLLRAMLLQAFYSIRSERLLMERLEYDLLFRRFVGIGVDAAAWDHSVFSKNRDRLLEGAIAAKFLAAVLALVQRLAIERGCFSLG